MQIVKKISAVVLGLSMAFAMSGCDSGGQPRAKSGVLLGGGIGALAGQAIGSSTEATLIGAAVGAGVGYMIGNEQDKEHAAEMSRAQSAPVYVHTEVSILGGTRWNLVSLSPRDIADPFVSKIVEFRSNGRAVTTTTYADGTVENFNESYRVVGNTLIVNKPGYIINAKFKVAGDQLIVNAENFSAVLKRLR